MFDKSLYLLPPGGTSRSTNEKRARAGRASGLPAQLTSDWSIWSVLNSGPYGQRLIPPRLNNEKAARAYYAEGLGTLDLVM